MTIGLKEVTMTLELGTSDMTDQNDETQPVINPEWLTTEEFGKRKGVKASRVRQWIKEGAIKATLIANRSFIHVSELGKIPDERPTGRKPKQDKAV